MKPKAVNETLRDPTLRAIMTEDDAITLAVEALGFLASDPDRAGPFLAQAGASPSDLRSEMKNPEFLGFVLDFILSDDAIVVAFAEETNRGPETVQAARAKLPGGDIPHWT